METVGFFGLGRMGGEIAARLVGAGNRVIGVDPRPEARRRARSAGVEAGDDPYSVDGASVVLSSLPDTPEVEDVYLGGLFHRLRPGTLCVDLSTIDVTASQRIGMAAAAAGHGFIDSPLSGTSIHAREGTLVALVGGQTELVERARPVLGIFSAAVHHLGDNGAGLKMKLITNRLLTSHLVAIAEAILEAEEVGLDPTAAVDTLAAGAVPRLLDYKAPPMSRRDHTPLFTVDLMSKDLRLAEAMAVPRPVGAASLRVMTDALEAGHGQADISAVIEVL